MQVPVTVCIPAYNSRKFIIDALDSIVVQSVDIEKIIVCDDCSKDDTYSLVKEWGNNHSNINLCLIRNKENLGYRGNFDICLKNCTTEFLQLLHANDVLKKDAILSSLEAFKANDNLALVGGN